MITKDTIENATAAYIHAYNYAIKETKNPSLAAHAAMSVIITVFSIEEKNHPKIDPMQALMSAIKQQVQKNEKQDKEEEKDE